MSAKLRLCLESQKEKPFTDQYLSMSYLWPKCEDHCITIENQLREVPSTTNCHSEKMYEMSETTRKKDKAFESIGRGSMYERGSEWVTLAYEASLMLLSTFHLQYFLKSSFLNFMSTLTHPLYGLTYWKSRSRERHWQEEDRERERSLILRELIHSGLHGFACLPVIVVCSLSISAPGNYWLVLIGKLLISCSLALFN